MTGGKTDMEKKELFNRKYLVALIFPLIIEQILAVSVGMADTIMVSGAGDAAVSGVGLVNTISNLLIYIFTALSTGGAIVASQVIGAKNIRGAGNGNADTYKKLGETVANQLILVCFVISLVIAALSVTLNRPILTLIYGSVKPEVMENAVIYFRITAFSFPFLAVYYGATALFRAMGNSKMSMYVSAIMNIINIVLNAVFVFGCKMGIAGVGYATLISRAFACVVVVFLIRNEKYDLHIHKYLKLGYNWEIIKKILRIGIPSGIDNGMFQIGKLFTQSLITSFGTASIAANTTASTIELLATIPASAMSIALTTVVGQCVGAGDYDAVKKYSKKMMKWAYFMLWGLNIVIIIMAPTIAGWYNLSSEGNRLAIQLIVYHSICCMLIWPLAFTMPSILRASGDVKFVMISSIVIMWVFRIGLAYLIGGYLGLGVLGVWIAMTIDWAARSAANLWRLKSGKWMKKAVVD